MEEAKEIIKAQLKRLAKFATKKILPVVLIVVLIVVLLAGSAYVVIKWAADVVSKAADNYMNEMTISANGTISNGKTMQELWDEMIKAGYPVDKYLDGPEELARMMQAELVTKYPDTRANPDAPIDWDAKFSKKSNTTTTSTKKTSKKEAINVLFLGNSKTEVNNVPGLVSSLSASLGKGEVHTDYIHMDLSGFYTEENENKAVKDKINERKWDYIVFQEQTDVSLDSSNAFKPSVEIIEYAKENSNEDVKAIYDVWGIYSDFNKSQYNLATTNAESMSSQTNASIAYIAQALLNCHDEYPDISLYTDDRHATIEGSYLAACCTYGAIYGEETKGATFTAGISEETAQKLQKTADSAQKGHNSSSSIDNVQGIIKFKRAGSDGSKKTMSYVDPDTFQSLINAYNSSGSESAKQEALSHFTLEKSGGSSGGSGAVAAGEGVMTDVSQAIIDAANSTGPTVGGHCLEWVDNVFDNSGVGADRKIGAYQAWQAHGISTDRNAIPIGAAVYATGSGSQGYGHIGIYIGSGQVMDCSGPWGGAGTVRVQDLDTWLSWQTDVLDGKQGWLGWGWEDGNTIRGTTQDPNLKENKKSTSKEEDKSTSKSKSSNEKTQAVKTGFSYEGGDGYNKVYTSSTGFTYKDFKQYEGSYAGNSYWGGQISGWGCGPTSVAILASGLQSSINYTPANTASEMQARDGYTYSTPIKSEMDSLGMYGEIIYSPSAEEIQNQLRNGKVMAVSVDSRTRFTGSSHIMAVVDINESGQVMILNPSGEDGSAKESGWYDATEITAGCNYIVVTDSGKVGTAASKSGNANSYHAVVATWKQTDVTITSNAPEEDIGTDREFIMGEESSTSYIMTKTNVNYEQLVEPYTLPFDLLWDFLVIGQDKNFIFEWADLAYNSKIEMTIHDNLTVNTDIDDWTYTKQEKVVVDGYAQVSGNGYTAKKTLTNDVHDPYKEDNYQTTKTVVTQTNTIKADLTRADTWIADYRKTYTYSAPSETSSTSEVKLDDEEYPESEEKTSKDFSCEHTKKCISDAWADWNAHQSSSNSGENKSEGEESKEPGTETKDFTAKYFYRYANIVDNITNKTSTQTYIPGTPTIKEKTDPKAKYSTIEASEGDYIVDITQADNIAIKDVETLKVAFAASGGAGSENLVAYAEDFLEFQETYKVNALFAAAVTTAECGAGTNCQIGGNNWWSITSLNGWRSYDSPRGAMEDFYRLISEGYFPNGQCSVDAMSDASRFPSHCYCEPAEPWTSNIKGYMSNMINAVGSDAFASSSSKDSAKYKDLSGFLFIGDSITWGLERLGGITDDNVEFRGVISAQPGEWLNDQAVDGVPTYSSLPEDSDSIKGICMMLGTNGVNGALESTYADMEKLIEKVHDKYPNKMIFVQKIFPVYGDVSDSEEYNKRLESLCSGLGYATCIDSTEGVELSDSVHPTVDGYKKLAENTRNNIIGSSMGTGSSKFAANFATIFNKDEYKKNKSNILSATDWLFEIIRENEKIADMEDIVRYLLNRALDTTAYGDITWEDIKNLFMPGGLKSINSGIVGDTPEEKVWWALINAGYSKEAAAGVMGNIEAESGFDPGGVESNGEGIGLCQWSFGRKSQLKSYAASKGKEWSDVDVQVQFLIGELTPGGGADGFASYGLVTYNGYSPSDWENATSPESAAEAFCWSFERPGIPHMERRKASARNYYNEFKDKEMPKMVASGNAIVDRARAEIGKPYVWGGVGPGGYDCSGLVSYAVSGQHTRLGTTNTFMGWQQTSNPQPGDIAVNSGHTGIYIGNGQMIHAADYGIGVIEGPVQSGMIFVKPQT